MSIRVAVGRVGIWCVLAAGAAGSSWALPAGAGGVKLDHTRFEARGSNEALLTVDRFGRFSLRTQSKQGTALQLVDRMAGPGPSDGAPGASDGRLDLLLDAGTYKVVATSSEKGQGTLTLSARAFQELNPQAPVLRENVPVHGRLEDLQQASYWLRIPSRQTVYLEAMGRDLADLRLWLEGNWLLDDRPTLTEASPVSGQPQARCLLIVDLEPGTYLLTAYGGPPKAWPKETGDHPFHLRSGLPHLDANTRFQASVSPFGADRFLVPKEADTFIVQLAEKRDFRLEVKNFRSGGPIEPFDASASITKKSQDPECRVLFGASGDFALVTVVGPPGDAYDLQVFQRGETFPVAGVGRYWLATLHSGFPDDTIDATGILVSDRAQGPHIAPVAADVVRLGPEKGWARRFNLLERETLYFFVEEAGTYEIRSEGTACVARFEPFMLTAPPGYEQPASRPGNTSWDLDAGYWVLTVEPQKKGIATVAVRKKGGLWQTATGALFGAGAIEPGPAKGACRFQEVILDAAYDHTLYVNHQEGVEAGLILRPLPLDLARPLPVTLLPGEEISVPFQAGTVGRLEVVAPAGVPSSLRADGGDCTQGCLLAAGSHTALLRNGGTRTATFCLGFTSSDLLPGAPPVFLPAEVEGRFQRFPVVTEADPLFMDLLGEQHKTALLSVSAPALYRVETTGLLATTLTLRTRTQTRLFEDTGGGIGRNGLIQAYLRPGEYQVTVRTVGYSAGHLGLRVRRAALTEGAPLLLGGETKEAVPTGNATLHPFEIPGPGTYALVTTGVKKTFRCRLEDRDGWPIVPPGIAADLTREFAPGRYRYISLPWDVDTLRSTRLAQVLPPERVEGRGPHPLRLNERLENVWREPAPGEERGRDLYDFTVPSEVDARIDLGAPQMQAYLSRREPGANPRIGEVPAAKGWSGVLAPGKYRLEVECGRTNDLLPYAVTVSVAQLVPGLSRPLAVPGELPVSVSRSEVVELSSAGALDVRAKLFRNSDGALVDASDDDFNDWNFRIARTLDPGLYTLRVEPVGGGAGSVRVSMAAPGEIGRLAPALPADLTVSLEGKINLIPLPPPPGEGLLVVRATGDSTLGCAIEKVTAGAVRPLAERAGRACEILLPVAAGGAYRLKLWSRDHQSETARVQLDFLTPPLLTEAAFRSTTLTPVSAAGLHVAAARIRIAAGGTFRVQPRSQFLVSRAQEEGLREPAPELVGLPAGDSVLAWLTGGGSGAQVHAERFALAPGAAQAVRLALPGGAAEWLDLKIPGNGLVLVTASSETGGAGCALARSGSDPAGAVLSDGYDFHDGGCVAASTDGPGVQVRVWNTDPQGPALPPTEIQADFFPSAEPEPPLPPGASSGEVPAHGRVSRVLPPGPHHLEMDLEAGLVAVLLGEGPATVVSARRGPVHRSLDTSASRLALLNPSASKAMFALSCLSGAAPASLELRPGGLFERVYADPGTVRLRLPDTSAAGEPLRLAAGPGVTVTVLNADGIARAENPASLDGRGASAWLTHGGGLVKAWLASEKEGLAARWGAPLPEALPTTPDAARPLTGPPAAFRLTLQDPGALHAETDGPAVLGLWREGSPGAWLLVREGVDRCAFDSFVEPGTYLVAARGLAGRSLVGTLRTTVTAVSGLVGGLGPETLAGEGESRTFSFAVRQPGLVGIGLQTGSERLTCDLFDRGGTLLGSGIQQFVRLESGTYLLRISAEPGSPPVRFRPVVVGLEPPGSGPPEEVLREFLTSIGVTGKGE